MPLKKIKVLLRALPLFLFIAGLGATADAAVSKTSKRVIRYAANPALKVVPGFNAAALSTTSLQWSWSTGTFTGSGITGYHLYSSSTAAVIDLSLNTTYYIDAGLGVNKQFTRWITSYDGSGQGSDSDHIEKYTYALPPTTITLSTVTAESVYVTWHFSSATAYAVECSTNNGTDYVRNRDVFVPWQTIPLLSNKEYLIRLGALNGDNELTPGAYSVIRATTTPPLDLAMTGVALSSYTIQWQWSTGTFTGTGITGYRIYRSTTAADEVLPADEYEGEAVADITGAAAASWIEAFVDGGTTTIAANSRHTRWIKAVGDKLVDGDFLVSLNKTNFQRYTYAIAPATTTVGWLDPDPYWVAHVWENSLSLIWTPRLGASEAGKYVIDYSTTAGFAVAVSSKITTGNPDTVTGLTENTKYDLRLGAINGDELQTPANGLNPFAYSQTYKVITRPKPPSDFLCGAFTDTALKCTWSASAYANPGYIDGYSIGDLHYRTTAGVREIYWDPLDFLPGVASSEYSLDYLLTNSSHTISVWVSQTDPAWVTGNPHFDASPKEWEFYYNNFGSYRLDQDAATFATPPNNVVFDTVTARSAGLWWKEPVVPATKYRIERSTTTGEKGPWVFISSVTGSHYNDLGPSPDGLTPQTTYSYRVGAVNLVGAQTLGLPAATGGNRRDYSFVSSTITKHIAPALSGTGASTTSITWAWLDTVPQVTSYNLYTATDGVIAAGILFPAASYLEVNLSSANARYTRRVRSVAPDGEGAYSEFSASTLTNPPTALVVTSSGIHSLSLSWTASESPRYKIDRSTNGILWTNVKNWNDNFSATAYSDYHLRYGTTYYYAVSGYNDDGAVSISSAIITNRTLPLPAGYTAVFATAAVSATAPLPAPSLSLITVAIPLGTPDGYFAISTNAAASPLEIPKSSLDAATSKLKTASLVPGSIVELHLYDVYGDPSALTAPARITFTYTDANTDNIVDGTTPQAQAASLDLFDLNMSALIWNQRQDSVVTTAAKSVYSDVGYFSFYALGAVTVPKVFSATALSTTSIEWSWPLGGTGIDGYHLYSSSAPGYIVLHSTVTSYTDTGLGVNKPYTRWVKVSSAAVEISESEHIQKYTYALPPDNILIPPYTIRPGTITATSAYFEWYWSTATAYDIQCSTNGGADYTHNRASFVPWQEIPLLSNRNYMVRLGAINGDNETTPGLYSAIRTFITPPLDMVISTAVALSSYTIRWSWATDIAATGITGYRIYSSTGGVVYSTSNVAISSWTETYFDGAAPAVPVANSQHGRWIKAVGILESPGSAEYKKYTYAIAPASCGLVSPDFLNVHPDSVNLNWTPRLSPSEAGKYVIDYATATVAESSADFNVALTSIVVAGPPALVTGLAWDTKHDFRIGAINGDNEQTPDNALNPYAYSARYKVITRLVIPVHSCTALTDTSLKWSWSTGTYTSMNYITGYGFGILRHTDDWGDFWQPLDYIAGVSSHEYDYNPPAPFLYPDPYLLTNSTHTRGLWAYQSWTPSCFSSPGDPACYYYFGSAASGSTCATFATPPNDVVFDTVAAHSIGIWWKEPEIPATKYQVERSTTTGEQGPWVFLSSVTGNHFLETGLTPSTTYSYRIGAINRLGFLTIGLSSATDGNRRDYSFVSSTVTKHISPALSGAAVSTISINWSWTDTLPGVTAYNLYTDTGGVIAVGLSSSTFSYLEVNLSSANARCTRRLRSVASDGEGDYSERAVSTLANPPAAPVIISSGVHTLSLGWTANGSARYTLDSSLDRNSWNVLKSTGDVFVSTSFTQTGLRFATTYYYSVKGCNDDGLVSVSSAITAAAMTLPPPPSYAVVFATAAAALSVTKPLPGLGQVTVTIPAGTPDSYFDISTSAAASPIDIAKSGLDAATAKLTSVFLLSGSIMELHLYDVVGNALTADLPSPARISVTYTDAAPDDDIVDGTQFQAASLRLFSLETTSLVWNQLVNSMLDKTTKTVYADIPHFSFYALGSIISAAGTIADVFAYPNPYKPGSAGVFGQSVYGDGIVFESLPARSRVKIFNLAGGLVKELADEDGDGRCVWDARNKDGARAASGIYLYLVTSPAGGKKSGRIAIIK